MVRPLVSVLAMAALLSVSPLCRGALAAEPEVIDGIAAVVNNDVITYSEVRGVSAPKEKLLHDQYRGEELANKIKEARTEALKEPSAVRGDAEEAILHPPAGPPPHGER